MSRQMNVYVRFGLASILVGCAGVQSPGGQSASQAGQPPGQAGQTTGAWDVSGPGAEDVLVTASGEVQDGTAKLVIRIHWPEKTIQVLPTSTTKVEFALKDGGGATVASTSVTRSQGASTATASFERLPAGQYTLSATAKNATGGIVATGTKSIVLVANRRNQAALTLTASNPPAISDFSPKAGGPGTQVSVLGTNFPTDETKMAVSLGGVAVPQGQTAAFGVSEFAFFVPAGATTSTIAVVADGIKATSAAQFVTVGGISIAPATMSAVASGSQSVFTATALDTAGTPQAAFGAPVSWSLSNVTGVNSSGGGAPGDIIGGGGGGAGVLGTFSATTGTTDAQGKASTTFTAKATGSAWINVLAGTVLKATVSITVE